MAFSREKLIISADDFGRSPLANENILSAIRSGKADRVAVMVNRSFRQDEVAELKKSGVKIDIHFDLGIKTEEGGTSRHFLVFLFNYAIGRISPKKMRRKWEEQIRKFEQLFGRLPDGINSHQHVHFFPFYFKNALELGLKYKIPYIRFGKKTISEKGNIIAEILSLLRKLDAHRFNDSSLDSSDYWASIDWIQDFPQFLENLPPGKTELVVHPEINAELETIKKYL